MAQAILWSIILFAGFFILVIYILNLNNYFKLGKTICPSCLEVG